jgi:hypothetical protein
MNIHERFALLAMMVALMCAPVKAENDQHHHQVTVAGVFATALGDVTNIKEIRNETSYAVQVWKVDVAFAATQRHAQYEILPARGVSVGDFWIPWADDEVQFSEHHIVISVNQREIARVWQSGEFVRFSHGRRFVSNARRVPGVARAGGNRRLVIKEASGGRFAIKFERLE